MQYIYHNRLSGRQMGSLGDLMITPSLTITGLSMFNQLCSWDLSHYEYTISFKKKTQISTRGTVLMRNYWVLSRRDNFSSVALTLLVKNGSYIFYLLYHPAHLYDIESLDTMFSTQTDLQIFSLPCYRFLTSKITHLLSYSPPSALVNSSTILPK